MSTGFAGLGSLSPMSCCSDMAFDAALAGSDGELEEWSYGIPGVGVELSALSNFLEVQKRLRGLAYGRSRP